MNKVFMVGNLTRATDSETTANGIDFCRFCIAVNPHYENAKVEQEADFFNVVA